MGGCSKVEIAEVVSFLARSSDSLAIGTYRFCPPLPWDGLRLKFMSWSIRRIELPLSTERVWISLRCAKARQKLGNSKPN